MEKEFLKNWKVEKYSGHPHYEVYAELPHCWQRVASIEDHLAESGKIAKAISALPELINACEGVEAFWNQFIDTMPVAFQTEINFIRAALEKAGMIKP